MLGPGPVSEAGEITSSKLAPRILPDESSKPD